MLFYGICVQISNCFSYICLGFFGFYMHTDRFKYRENEKVCYREVNNLTLDPQEYANLLPEVRTLVNRVVQRNMADSMLFSAGTDTQIIIAEVAKYKPKLPCLTMHFKHGNLSKHSQSAKSFSQI